MKKSLNLIFVVASLTLLAVGAGLQHWGMTALGGMAMRWVACAVFLVYAWRVRSLTPWFFVMMVLGTELGIDAPKIAMQFAVFPDIFLRLIKTIVAPLVLSMLVVGIAGHGDLKGVGRMGWKSLVYFEVATTAALVIGLLAIDISRAGVGLGVSFTQAVKDAPPPTHWNDFLLHVFPENLAKSIAEGQILQVVVFAVLFGCALAMVSEAKRAPVLRLAEGVSETMLKFTHIVMYFAPLAVGAAMAYTVGHLGVGVLLNLGKLLVTLYAALVVFALCVMLPAALIFKVPVRGFVRAVAEPATIAFATGASEAALPSAMESMERFGVPRRVVAFVIPAGYSFNLDGSTLYLAIASMFVAQAGGVHFSVGQQLAMLGTLIITSKGVAGVPKSVMVVLLATASTFHLPEGPIMVLLASDALLDMARTVINVTGNCLASAIVARWEGVFGVEERSLSVEERVMVIE